MGLMKTLSQSSKELKDILDRLTALESGKTFVPKARFDLLEERVNDIDANLFLSNHPVGSIYMSVENTNPSTLFGGIWIDWGTGRVPVCVDTTDANFNAVEKTGGEKTHTLTVNEIPNHAHGFESGGTISYTEKGVQTGSGANCPQVTGGGNATTATGGGQAHNNLQPYITCYMWKRVA